MRLEDDDMLNLLNWLGKLILSKVRILTYTANVDRPLDTQAEWCCDTMIEYSNVLEYKVTSL